MSTSCRTRHPPTSRALIHPLASWIDREPPYAAATGLTPFTGRLHDHASPVVDAFDGIVSNPPTSTTDMEKP